MVLGLTGQLYKNVKFMYKINKTTNFNIFLNIVFIIILISNLDTIIYSSAAKIF